MLLLIFSQLNSEHRMINLWTTAAMLTSLPHTPPISSVTTEKLSVQETVTPAPEARRQQTKRTRLHLSRRRRPQVTTEVTPEVAPEAVTSVNNGRRQYTSIQRNRYGYTYLSSAIQ